MSIPESALNYGSILTLAGENAEINGKLNSKPINFTHIAIGDANDVYVQPSRTQTALVHELARIPITGMEKITPSKPDAVPQLKVWAKIPDDIVDIAVREFAAVATFDGTSYLHAVGNTVRIPILSGSNNGGEVNDIYIEMTFAVTSLDPIVMIDPTIVTATRKFVKDEDAKHLAAANPHPQYMRFGDEAAYWASMPIGVPFPLVGDMPQYDDRYRYIVLTDADPYNDSVLISKEVSGTAPNLVIKYTIDMPDSPLHGAKVEMLNSMEAVISPSVDKGKVFNDTIRNIEGTFGIRRSTANALGTAMSADGAFRLSSRSQNSNNPIQIDASVQLTTEQTVVFAASNAVPTGGRNQTFAIGAVYLMRIK
ncbi:TPA: phage tail protein [Vibrio cholerae]